jgi:hypothetical protein
LNAQTLAAYATVLGVGIGIGAAIVGAVWRWWTWRQEHGTLLTAQIGMGFLAFGPKLVEAISVTVYNRSRHPVRVTGVGIETNDGSKRVLVQIMPQPGAGIPGTVNPHDSAMTWFERDPNWKANGLDVQRPTRCRITIAERAGFIWSKRRRLEGKD